ncbi:MAG TPA: hypothetical protein PK163_03925 [Steroidobacteraceae bacterium]|nr:hypothetical protein [Steroidobacteraceae bacterium]
MFTRQASDRFLDVALAGLTIAVTVVMAAATHAIVAAQSFI